jgi:amino acid transporter
MKIMSTSETADEAGVAGLDATALRPWNVVAIAVSAISPTTSVFLVYGSVLEVSGTGVVWAFVVGALIALAMALCYAEVGSVFPSAGGVYALVRGALGPVAGGVTAVLFMLLGLVSTASILVAAATYVGALTPAGSLSTGVTGLIAFGFLLLVTALSVGRIAPASWAAAGMLGLEIAVIVVFTVAAFAHPAAGPGAAFTAPVGPGGGALGAAALLAGVAPALFAFNGYDWPLYFAEETPPAQRRALPRAVLLSAALAVVLEVLAVVAATGAVRDVGATAAADSPLAALAREVMGPVGTTVLLLGVVVAMVDTGLAANLGYARVYYAAARDGMLPGPVGRFLSRVSARSRVPVGAIVVLFVGNGILCLAAGLDALITATSVVIVVIYLLVAASALVSRVRDRERPASSFRMPLWPLPPVVAIVGAVLALVEQSVVDLVVALGIAVVAAVGFFLVRRRLPPRQAPG